MINDKYCLLSFIVQPFTDLEGLVAALILLFLAIAFAFSFRRHSTPAFYQSHLYPQNTPPTLKERFSRSPVLSLWLAFGAMLLALVNPVYVTVTSTPPSNPEEPASAPPQEGIAIYLVLDQSGSMESKINGKDSNGRRVKISKLDMLKQLTRQFVLQRKNDLIGMVSFARTAQIISPLTLDQRTLLEKLNDLDIMRIQDQDGTSIGYAIYKTAHMVIATRHFAEDLVAEGKPAYSIKSAVIILVTDGSPEINPLDEKNPSRSISVEEAAKYAAENHIKVYIVNVEPEFSAAKHDADRKEMQRLASLTGGKFFHADETHSLSEIYQQIDQLEKSKLPAPTLGLQTNDQVVEMQEHREELPLAKFFIAAAAMFVLASVLMETLWLRKIP